MPPRNMPFFGPPNQGLGRPIGGMQRNPFTLNRPGMLRPFGAGFGHNPVFRAGGGPAFQGRGGLLSRLFQRGGQNAAMNPANAFQRGAAGGGGSLLKSIANPNSISSFLNNTQNVIKTAQQVGPMIQQYGPLIKNLPAMWKMYRGLKNAPVNEAGAEESSGQNKKRTSPSTAGKTGRVTKSADRTSASSSRKKKEKKKEENIQEKGASVPKLFI
ncbi:hypothetical protein BpJC7_08760 [Weizmannia acidilactici]|uniref:YqfQ-like protein n=1 Tax=Weizmannia acidilactici TaxID=2607726 RepID=A0A5J4JC90_9BACI|nr:VrrA/YqfQ family protein [Weizmannia acidilactici]GER66920.1 hypothetical protein BpJC4_13910 [Weizmannia acidilactici]GER69573.1 hypothetical protein BpJC7_08760 [Weizmannia acidilactici]GER72750.1 hypothetical protein BpPP18_08170 [Weizmannia acidilactici]